ncbi:MAG: hypothetical protein WDA02_10895 [Saccharofermentanales bacterium]
MGVINIQNIKVLKNPYSKTLTVSDPITSKNEKNKNNGIDTVIKKLIIEPIATVNNIGIKKHTLTITYSIIIPNIVKIASGIVGDINIVSYDIIPITNICKIIKYTIEYVFIILLMKWFIFFMIYIF